MKIKIVGDGTLFGTSIVDAATGERIDHVKSVTWRLDAADPGRLATAVVEFIKVPVDVEIEVEAGAPLPVGR